MSKWQTKSMKDVCQFRGGGTPSKAVEHYWQGDIPWVSPKDMKLDIISDSTDHISQEAIANSSASMIPAGSVLVVVRSGILARTIPVAITGRDLAINQDLKAFCPNANIDSVFLYYLLKSRSRELLAKVTRGATVHRLTTDQLRSLTFSLPSLTEQKRIVAILDDAFERIDTAIANTEKNLANARELFESYLNKLFEQENPEWTRCSLSELLTREWITSHLDGNHGAKYPRKNEFIDHGVPYIAAKSMNNGQVDFSVAKFLSPERAATLTKGVAQNNDVLFAHNATVGPVAILKTDEEKVLLGTSLTYYRCNKKHILPEYLAHYMRSPSFVSQYKLVMRQSTRNQVPITKQRTFMHVIPPIGDQRRIASKLDDLQENVRRLEAIYQQKLDALTELKQSILQKAFAGELTVGMNHEELEN